MSPIRRLRLFAVLEGSSFLLLLDACRLPLTALLPFLFGHLRRDCPPCAASSDGVARRLLRPLRASALPLAFRLDRIGLVDLRRARPDLDRQADETLVTLRALPAPDRRASSS